LKGVVRYAPSLFSVYIIILPCKCLSVKGLFLSTKHKICSFVEAVTNKTCNSIAFHNEDYNTVLVL